MTANQEFEPQARAAADGDEIDLRAYWRIIVRRRWLIGAVFASVVVLTLLFTLRQTKIYAAAATLIIDLNAPRGPWAVSGTDPIRMPEPATASLALIAVLAAGLSRRR